MEQQRVKVLTVTIVNGQKGLTTADENLETPLCVLSVSCFAMLKIWFELRETVHFFCNIERGKGQRPTKHKVSQEFLSGVEDVKVFHYHMTRCISQTHFLIN